MKKNHNISIISLGCSKNLVDSECMTTILKEEGYVFVDDISLAEAVIINTCGFIESAKTEAIDTILEVAQLKKKGKKRLRFIVATGCLAQRYPKEIKKSLPEVDAVLGTSHYQDIAKVLNKLFDNDSFGWMDYIGKPGSLSQMRTDRILSTKPYAWLKIAEGCSNGCAFCAIPSIRGKYISRPMEDILKEAENITKNGPTEIILAAQDTTSYGKDLYKKRMLPELLSKLAKIEGVRSIRIMYAYIDGIDDALIKEMARNPKVLHYLDIPVQHGDDEILKKMRRRDTVASITSTLERLRKAMPDITIRSTVMVGFPGEKKEHFENLLKNIAIWKFQCLGCFIYSPEENTLGYNMHPRVRKDVSERRYAKVMELQQGISLAYNEERVGKIVNVSIDNIADDGIFYIGRSEKEAPEIDSAIYVASTNRPLNIGDVVQVKILECTPYELTGVTVDESAE
ncbi:MAG: 30S ribosomal protein S12 methylthiotransferase RimO [Clostridiales bacterium]|nr:30S ribosomal protein S12 methylthiotransferase RimO [Clostridiales bacterium]